MLRYDAMSLAELLRARGASPGAVAVMRLGYLDEWGDGVERCSALSLLRDLAQQRGGGGAFLVDGGTDRLPRAFAARLGDRVRYGADMSARSIDWPWCVAAPAATPYRNTSSVKTSRSWRTTTWW